MMTFLVTMLFLLTILASFALGIGAGYWVIRGFLNFFDPKRSRRQTAAAPVLAPTASGD